MRSWCTYDSFLLFFELEMDLCGGERSGETLGTRTGADAGVVGGELG